MLTKGSRRMSPKADLLACFIYLLNYICCPSHHQVTLNLQPLSPPVLVLLEIKPTRIHFNMLYFNLQRQKKMTSNLFTENCTKANKIMQNLS